MENKFEVVLTEAEYELYKKFKMSEAANLSDRVDIPTMVADLEEYIADNGIEVKSDADLVQACEEFLTVNGYESLVGTEVVDEIVSYVNDHYNA